MQQIAKLQLEGGAVRAEDICLAADEFVIDARFRGTRSGPTLTIGHRARGCRTELALLDGHRLAVRARAARRPDRRYVVDLRFVDTPATLRTIAWNCWLGSLAGAGAAGLVAWFAVSMHGHAEVWAAWIVSLGFAVLAMLAGAAALYRTHETILLRSVHGRVTLAALTGGLGAARQAARFQADLAERTAAARAERSQSRQHFLRDELREHRRLFEQDVLSREAYEAGKRRILQAHD